MIYWDRPATPQYKAVGEPKGIPDCGQCDLRARCGKLSTCLCLDFNCGHFERI